VDVAFVLLARDAGLEAIPQRAVALGHPGVRRVVVVDGLGGENRVVIGTSVHEARFGHFQLGGTSAGATPRRG
jgi:hypothetical protein